MATIGSVAIGFKSHTGDFEKGANKVSKRLDSLEKRSRTTGRTLKALITGLKIGAFIRFVRNTTATADAQIKLARSLDITLNQLRDFNHEASRFGVSASQMQYGFQRIAQSAGEAFQGSQRAIDAFSQIGLTLEQMKTMNPAEMFNAAAKAISGMGNAAERADIANRLFGRSGRDLMPMLMGGGVQGGRSNMTGRESALIEEFSNKLANLGFQVQTLAFKLLAEMAPALGRVIEGLTKAADALTENNRMMKLAGTFEWLFAIGRQFEFFVYETVIGALADFAGWISNFINKFSDSRIGRMLGLRMEQSALDVRALQLQAGEYRQYFKDMAIDAGRRAQGFAEEVAETPSTSAPFGLGDRQSEAAARVISKFIDPAALNRAKEQVVADEVAHKYLKIIVDEVGTIVRSVLAGPSNGASYA